jgi:hypothetical protein
MHRCKCPRCSGLVIKNARARALATRVRSGDLPTRISANLAIREQLEQSRAPEQPLLDQLLSAAGLIRRNAMKEK